MEMNWIYFFPIALIPLVIGSIWYNPKVFGTVWMRTAGLTEEQAASGNMALIFGLVYIFSLFVCMFAGSWAIHQFSTNGLFATQPGFADGTDQAMIDFVNTLNTDYANLHRTFGHGAVHGGIGAVFIALPIIAIISLFERRGWKYIMVHFGYWLITLILMCGTVCQFV